MLVSIHGLIRGNDLELGRDADTGGQTLYVVELARALARHPDVWRVDLMTRQVVDQKVSEDYGEHIEAIDDGAFIVRLPCGPRRYLRKEKLWPYLDSFTDHALQHVRRIARVPDVIHSHYADAGYVGSKMAQLLGVPLMHTGHSLGRVKRQRLMEQGVTPETIEKQYNISVRIEAEEKVLGNTAAVITSTRQEVDEQYALYDNYQPGHMHVIPPGVNLERFYPPRTRERHIEAKDLVEPFLRDMRKPMILALSRADERKNIQTLVRAFGERPALRELANLVIVAGNREDIQEMDRGPRSVLTEILMLIDRYDLYGSVAYPKHHNSEDIPGFYRLAAKSHGIFINPALTEPFGLTLIEAAASGLPILATKDGGPRDIIRNCRNGRLIDPLDHGKMGYAMQRVIADRALLKRWARNGIQGANRFYTWESHVEMYLRVVHKSWGGKHKVRKMTGSKSRLPTVDRMLVCDVDDTLLGDRRGLSELLSRLKSAGDNVGFGIATGRNLQSALQELKKWKVPTPDFLITSVGAEIHYGRQMVDDLEWRRHIEHRWEPQALREVMRGFRGLKMQPRSEQHPFKISYFVDEKKAPGVREIVSELRKADLHAKVIQSHGMFLDLLPIRASKGLAVRYLGARWGLEPERFLVAGDAGNDEELLLGNTLGVVVGNYSPELERLRGRSRIYFAEGELAWGILEGIGQYDFLGKIRIPEEEG